MFLNKNIKAKNNNPFYHFIIGLIFSGMTAWVVTEGLRKENGIDQFDWIYIIMFGLVGIYFVYKGLNILIRTAYIRVDDEKIAIKPDETSKSEIILWRDIQRINVEGNNYEVLKKDGSSYTIYFSYLNYDNADELRKAIDTAAKEKGIIIRS